MVTLENPRFRNRRCRSRVDSDRGSSKHHGQATQQSPDKSRESGNCEGIASGSFKYQSRTISDLRVGVYGDTAVVTGAQSQKGAETGKKPQRGLLVHPGVRKTEQRLDNRCVADNHDSKVDASRSDFPRRLSVRRPSLASLSPIKPMSAGSPRSSAAEFPSRPHFPPLASNHSHSAD